MYHKHFRTGSQQTGSGKQFNYRSRPKVGGFHGGHRGAGRSSLSRNIDVNRFINKPSTLETKSEPYVPKHAFGDFNIDNRLKTNISAKNYYVPTPIQDQAMPHILAGADIVGIANTGTGKTAAFLIPLIDKVIKSPNQKVLIVVPTRELAVQIEGEFKGFANHLNMRTVCAVGGASIGLQIGALSRHPQFLIGTPGRLRDLIDRGKINLAQYDTVVLDEADRMLDMGFINDVKFMIAKMPAKRHTLFFSATISREIQGLISHFLKNPVTISVKTGETPAAVDQDVVRVPVGKNKFDVLTELLHKPDFNKVLIFGKTKHGVERLARNLAEHGFKAESIHGNKSQPQRQKALNLFKEHHMNILVATDVAARGLDIAGVSHVINYDIPATYDDYVHRIGRTGRGGRKGRALTFV